MTSMNSRNTVVAGLLLATASLVCGADLKSLVAETNKISGAPAVGALLVSCTGRMDAAVSGVARVDAQDRLQDDARFNIGSNAKSMLASRAATFVQDGTISWSTTIGEVLGQDFPDMEKQIAKANVAQLLSHRSGLPGFDTGRELRSVKVSGDTASAQRQSFVRQVLSNVPAYPVGTRFVYSDAGYVVVGLMLERIGGRPFENLMQERLFQPLGMHPEFGTPVRPAARQPWGHFSEQGKVQVYADDDVVIPAFLQAAGDVSLTMTDYAAFLREHLCGLQGKPTKVLNASSIAAMHEPQGPDGAAMGWGRFELNGNPSSVHVGGTGTFSAFVAMQPTRDRGMATMTNSGDEAARTAALTLLKRLSDAKTD